MTNPGLARTRDAVAHQTQVVAGLTTERRRSIGADAQTVLELEGAVDHGVRLLKRVHPPHAADA